MKFESKAKADAFIRWNGDGIYTGGAELRSYYCEACCGWHITHHRWKEDYEGRTERLIDAWKRTEEEKPLTVRLLDVLKGAGLELVQDKTQFRRWAQQNLDEGIRKPCCDLAGELRSQISKDKKDWRLDYLRK